MLDERISNRTASSTHRLAPGFALALICSLILVLCHAPDVIAQQPQASEAEIEAVYVFKFSQFITWPRNAPSRPSFDICILGDDPLGPFLDRTIRGETIGGKPVVDRRIARTQDAPGCAIVYVSRSEAFRLRQDLTELRALPVLTVSDIPEFADKGGMIEFVLQSGRVRFAVNLTPAEQVGLSFSSELLKVAVDVKGAGAQGSH